MYSFYYQCVIIFAITFSFYCSYLQAQFSRELVRPLHYLATYREFVNKIEVEEVMVIAFFDFTNARDPPGFRKYHQIAMEDLESGEFSVGEYLNAIQFSDFNLAILVSCF